jgi:hypothetical protein
MKMGPPYLPETKMRLASQVQSDDQQSIPKAVKEVNRWLDKLGFPVPMADASRSRWKA